MYPNLSFVIIILQVNIQISTKWLIYDFCFRIWRGNPYRWQRKVSSPFYFITHNLNVISWIINWTLVWLMTSVNNALMVSSLFILRFWKWNRFMIKQTSSIHAPEAIINIEGVNCSYLIASVLCVRVNFFKIYKSLP